MAVLESIFTKALTAPNKTAVITDGRVIGYRAYAAAIVRMRRFMEAQAIDRDQVAILCVGELASGWIIGLALRSLGVTTVHARTLEDVERLGFAAFTVVSSDVEVWPGLAAVAVRVGARCIEAPSALYARDAPTIALDQEAPVLAVRPGGQILLTSGTTGVNKKVLIDPAFEAQSMALRADLYGLTGASVVNLFDFGGWTVAGYQTPISVWGQGGAVMWHQGPDRWRSLTARDVTLAYTQPAMLASLLDAPAEAELRNDAMTVIVGAGVLSQADWRAARDRLTSDIRTSYGSTEAGPCALTRIETHEDLVWHQIHPAFEVQVVDDQHQPTPAGGTGAVRVRTSGVDGYLADAATTRAFFRDGFFYPGDLGMLREDGRLQILGRVTDVINVMGDKIATTPIERSLQAALGAKAVCVFSAPGESGVEEVHVVIEPGEPVSQEALKAALRAALPRVRAVRFHAVTSFARNQMGKIDRLALRARLAPGPGQG